MKKTEGCANATRIAAQSLASSLPPFLYIWAACYRRQVPLRRATIYIRHFQCLSLLNSIYVCPFISFLRWEKEEIEWKPAFERREYEILDQQQGIWIIAWSFFHTRNCKGSWAFEPLRLNLTSFEPLPSGRSWKHDLVRVDVLPALISDKARQYWNSLSSGHRDGYPFHWLPSTCPTFQNKKILIQMTN